jgi:hypothetical protein
MTGTVTELRRRDVGKLRRASHWEQRAAAATTLADKAAVGWDAARARIKRLPPADQELAYRQLVAALNSIAPDLGAPRIRITEEAS